MNGRNSVLQNCRNILLIQLGDIGDVVLTTPTIRAVKETYPDARVSILVFKPYGSLLASDPHIYEVVETAKIRGSLWHRLREYAIFAQKLRQTHYDLVVDLRTGDRGAILSFLTRASVRVGRQGIKKQFWHELLFTQIIRELKIAPPPVHPGADQSLRVVRGIGIDTSDSMPRLYIAPGDRQSALDLLVDAGIAPDTRMATVNPFSRWKYKEWSNRKWGEVIDRLWESHHFRFVLIGSPEEAAACQGIVAGRETYAFNLAGKTSLGELAAVISMSALHLGVDSAAPHIAAALSTPTITLHGPTDWRGWRIIDKWHKVVSANMECVPCNMKGCENCGISQCLEQLDCRVILDAADELFRLMFSERQKSGNYVHEESRP